MALPKPFGEYIRTQRKYDAIIMRILEAAAIAIEKRLRKLDTTRFSASVRASQLRLALAEIRRDQRDMWLDIGDVIRAGQLEAAMIAVDDLDRLTRVMLGSLNDEAAQMLAASIRATAASGLKSLYARQPITISPNVTAAADKIDEIIRTSLASGLSAKEFARDVRSYISPRTPGGASYAAMRIARTEINNAFHQRQIASMDSPGVLGAKWNLSGSHKKPDDCNKFAETDQYDMGAGIFPRGQVPKKPHPHCLCFLTMVTMDPDEFVAGLRAGKFDDELRKRFNVNRQSLGMAPKPTPVTKPPVAKKAPAKKATPPRARRPRTTEVDGEVLSHLERINNVGSGTPRAIVEKALVKNARLVPNSMRRLKDVRTLSGRELIEWERDYGPDSLGGYLPGERRIESAGGHIFEASYQKTYRDGLESGWWSRSAPGVTGGEGFMSHEIGHHVYHTAKRRGQMEVKKIWDVLAKQLKIPPPSRYSRSGLDDYVLVHHRLFKKEISEYGSTDSEEVMAEIWHEYVSAGENARPHIKAIGKVLQRIAESEAEKLL